MNLLMINRIAAKALTRNMLRTGLTMLGVIIGVAAVICTIAIGEGATSKIREAISSIGANMIWIEAGGMNKSGVRTGAYGTKSLSVADMKAIQQQISLVINVSPNVDAHVQLIYGNQNWNTSVRGVSPEYLAVKGWPVIRGDMFTERDIESAANVCVLGRTVVEQLFQDQDPVGETIRVKDQTCKVVGVLGPKGQSPTGQDQDDTLFMPYTTVQKKLKGQYWLDDMMMSAVSADVAAAAEDQIRGLLRDRHHLRPGTLDDFNLRHPTEIAEAVAQSARTMEVLLACVASVSLLVGGVGIMNIMLVSVTERTREIGLRLAIGARGRDVLLQFLLEAIILSLIGGAIGIGLGIFGTRMIADLFQWPTRVSPNAIALAVAFSAAIGIFFGYYPARRASALDPIEALRFE